MKIFLDLGSHRGQTVEAFYDKQLVEDTDGFEIYCFEPQDFAKDWDKLSDIYPNIMFMKCAAWIYDGDIEMSVVNNGIDPDSSISTTIYKRNLKYKDGKKESVPCIDFAKWLTQFNGEIYLKINIEGAEFELLEHLLKTGEIKRIKKVFIEWHDTKVEPVMTEQKNDLIRRIKEAGVEYTNWRRKKIVSFKQIIR